MGLLSGLGKVGSVVGSVVGAVTGNPGITAGANALGSLIGQSSANSANRDLVRQQEEFQQYNSNTAYQRAVADMQAAGLNPMLAYSQGGASTPSGSIATMQDAVTPAINSANNARSVSAAVENMAAQTQNTKSQTVLNSALVDKAKADAALSATSAKSVATNTALAAAGLPAAKNSAAAADTWYGRNVSPYLPDLLSHSAKSAASGGIAAFFDN